MPLQDTFSQRLLAWFAQSGRHDLPWQQQPNAYRIWVSEVMLQQTQVNTVIAYYMRFMQRFPTVQYLANAELDSVLHLWTGLGYYARARNLHRAAQKICAEYAGELPQNQTDLQALSGIGRSTASAILALAYHQQHSILDGNVKRVLSRYHAVAGWSGHRQIADKLWDFADQHTPDTQVADYTQAIMDLGATVCTRSRPHCTECPQQNTCQAYQTDQIKLFPQSRPRKVLPIKQTRMLLIQSDDALLLQQRPTQGLWGGLWIFPECDTDLALLKCDVATFNLNQCEIHTWATMRHTFTHFHLDIHPILIRAPDRWKTQTLPHNMRWYRPHAPDECGLAAPVVKLLQQVKKDMQ